MHLRNITAAILLLLSLCCLIPGLTQPVLGLKIGAALPLVGTINLYEKTQSILQTVITAYENKNILVAFLILLFSILVPVFKALALLATLFLKNLKGKKALHRLVALISKWSMADVFVVGIFIAFLATDANDAIDAQLGTGFYWFLAYCLLSIAATQIMTSHSDN